MSIEFLSVLFCVGSVLYIFILIKRYKRLEREKYIRRYVFGSELFNSLKESHPDFGDKEVYLIARALRQFFLVYLRSNKHLVGMPSRVVDDLWHEFILDTKKYTEFCKKAFGRYFHHIPASKNVKAVGVGSSLMLTWRLACLEENINPEKATRLPLLFAIDAKLNILGGNLYQASSMRSAVHKSDSSSSCSSGCSGGSSCSGDS